MPEFEEHTPKPVSDPDFHYKPSKSQQIHTETQPTEPTEENPKEDLEQTLPPKMELVPKMELTPKMEVAEVKEQPKAVPTSNLRGRWKRAHQAENKSAPAQSLRSACGEVENSKGFQEKLSGTSPHKPKDSDRKHSEPTRSDSEKPKSEDVTTHKQSRESSDREGAHASRSNTPRDGQRRPAPRSTSHGTSHTSKPAVTGSMHKPKAKSSAGFVGAIKKAIGSIFGGESEPKKTGERSGMRSSQGRSGSNHSSYQRTSSDSRGKGQDRAASESRGGQRRSNNSNRPRSRSSQGNRPPQKTS